MKHYSVMARDIFIHKIHNEKGWRLGDPLHFEVNNCEWKSRIEAFIPGDRARHNELILQPYYLSGDREKMMNDTIPISIALQSHIGQQYTLTINEII